MRALWPLEHSGKAADQVQQHQAGLTLTPMEHIDMKAEPKTTSTSAKPRPSLAMKAVELRMSSIASTADAIRELLTDAQEHVGGEDADKPLAALIEAGTALATNIGILADMTAIDAGGTGLFGDAAGWLLTPAERELPVTQE